MRFFNCDCYYEYLEENYCSCCVTHNEDTKSYFERNNICGYYDPVEVVRDLEKQMDSEQS